MFSKENIMFFIIGLNIALLYLYLNSNNVIIKKVKKNRCIY